MRYLLDTNFCIEFLRGKSTKVKEKLVSVDAAELAICTVVQAELLVGAALSQNATASIEKLTPFLLMPTFSFDLAAAREYAEIRASLHKKGMLIGANDLLIAAIARTHRLVLITHNTSEFSRVDGLQIEDWQA